MWAGYLSIFVALCFLCGALPKPQLSMNTDIGFPIFASTGSDVSDAKARNIKGQEVELSMALNIDSHWEEFLMPGPLAVALIGQLIVLGNEKDFQFSESLDKYKYIRHDRFGPTMIQVSNDAWVAFHEAHKNMDMMRLHMLSIPHDVTTILMYLSSGSAVVVQKFMPIPLDAITLAAGECVKLAKATDEKFVNVMLLLNEVDEAISATKSATDAKLVELEAEINETKVEKEYLTKQQSFTQEAFNNISQQLANDRRAYEKALSDIPTGWEAVGMELVRSINPMQLISVFMGTMSFGGGHNTDGNTGGGIGVDSFESIAENAKNSFQDQMVLTRGEGFNNVFQKVGAKVKDWIASAEKFGDKALHGSGDVTNVLKTLSVVLRTAKSSLDGITSKWAGDVRNMLDQGFNEIQSLQNITEKGTGLTKGVLQEAKSKIDGLVSKSKSFGTIKATLGNPSIRQTPNSSGGGSGSGDCSDEVGCAERYIAAQRENTLHMNTARYDSIFQQVVEGNKEMSALMVKLASFDISRANYEEIRKVIQQGIAAIANLKKQWGQLIRFFELISNVASVTMKNTVDDFFKLTEKAGQMVSQLSDDALEPVRDVLAEESARIATVSRFLYTLSDTYVNISNTCIMDRLANISALQAIEDPAKQKVVLKQLFDGSQAAQAKIAKIAEQKRQDYKVQVDAQIEDIQHVYKLLGHPSEDDKRAIEKANKEIKEYQGDQSQKVDFQCPMC